MLMVACEKCHGFPEFPFGHALNVATAETTPDAATKDLFAQRKRTAK